MNLDKTIFANTISESLPVGSPVAIKLKSGKETVAIKLKNQIIADISNGNIIKPDDIGMYGVINATLSVINNGVVAKPKEREPVKPRSPVFSWAVTRPNGDYYNGLSGYRYSYDSYKPKWISGKMGIVYKTAKGAKEAAVTLNRRGDTNGAVAIKISITPV